MDFGKITLFAAMKQKLGWLAQRQEVLAQNVANADTPGARAFDLKPFDFATLVKRRSMQIELAATQANHLAGNRKRVDIGDTENRRPYETAPAGNAVVLEEQMMKLSENEVDYKLTTELYRKHLGLFRKAIGRSG
jgi:flagellar basal-body rod protein FlgB